MTSKANLQSLDQVLREFLAESRSIKNPRRGLAAVTHAGYTRALLPPARPGSTDHLAAIRGKPITKLSRVDLERLRETCPTETLRKLKVALAFAYRRGYVESNPAEGVRVASPGRDPRCLVRRQEDGTWDLSAARAVWHAAETRPEIRLALLTAVRPDELYRLDWAGIRELDGRFPTMGVSGKTGPRTVPLSTAAVDLLRAIGPKVNGPIFPERIGQRELARLVARSGVTGGWSLKRPRKSVRTWLEVHAGTVIGRLALGHSLGGGVDGHYLDSSALTADLRKGLNGWATALGVQL